VPTVGNAPRGKHRPLPFFSLFVAVIFVLTNLKSLPAARTEAVGKSDCALLSASWTQAATEIGGERRR
jgi:hypothetical protein